MLLRNSNNEVNIVPTVRFTHALNIIRVSGMATSACIDAVIEINMKNSSKLSNSVYRWKQHVLKLVNRHNTII